MKLYVVEGMYDTDLEGMVFAVCTSKEKAEKALKMTFDGEDVEIVEMIADSIILDDEVIEMWWKHSFNNKKEVMQMKAINIDWETDNEVVELPNEVEITSDVIGKILGEEEMEVLLDGISDYLSDTYGWLHNGYEIEG